MIATVTSVGLCTVQDAGRPGHESVGVPTAGAWHRDRHAALAALMTGEADPAFPALELTAGHVALSMAVDACVAVCGPGEVVVDGRPIAAGVVVAVHAGAHLKVTCSGRGPAYVGVSGWRPDRTLGSCSVDTFSGLGGRPLARGDVLDGAPVGAARVGWFLRPEPASVGPLRIVPVPGGACVDVCASSWRVLSGARSGTRLRSSHRPASSGLAASQPVLPGAVQVTPDGEAIILGPDGAVTGGYPVVGVIATADLGRVSMLAHGDEVRFEPIDVDGAVAAHARAVAARARRLIDPSRLA